MECFQAEGEYLPSALKERLAMPMRGLALLTSGLTTGIWTPDGTIS